MPRSKKIFLLVSAVFLIIVLYISYDIARRTTFPGTEVHKADTADSATQPAP